ncbi:MAG: hypothetical protein CMJ18_10130 [Phycisphaeraceae bacterium]|nr:hypothetical protein [Phycisphaeraceae bacterium]
MDWHAKWIWKRDLCRLRNVYLYARKTFELAVEPTAARLACCADSRYRLWVNGSYAGRGPVRSDPRWQYYDVYTDLPLVTGRNVIAFDVHYMGEGSLVYVLGPGGLLCQLDGTCDGGPVQVGTDESWRVMWSDAWSPETPRMNIMRGFIENHDAAREPQGWREPDFDDSPWARAEVLGPVGIAPWTSLVERDIPMLREHEVFPDKVLDTKSFRMLPGYRREQRNICFQIARRQLTPLEDGDLDGVENVRVWGPACGVVRGTRDRQGVSVLLDFGQEVSGFPTIRLSTEQEGVIVDFAYSEFLTNGTVDTMSAEARGYYADRYHTRKGSQQFEVYLPRSLRYLRVDFSNLGRATVQIESISMNAWEYPVGDRGSFECSDELLNRIWDISRRTLHLCMADCFMDGPARERTQWVGDAWAQALVNYYAFGDLDLARKFLRQVAQSQREDGSMWAFYPADFPFGGDYIVPVWNMLWVRALWDFYVYSGEMEILEELLPSALRFSDWLRECEEEDGLLHDFNGWYFFDWSDNIEQSGSRAVYNMFYCDMIERVARMAETVGRDDVAETMADRARVLAEAIRRTYWSDERDCFVDFVKDGAPSAVCSEHAQILATWLGIVQAERGSALLRRVLAGQGQWIGINSLFFCGILLLALSEVSEQDSALAYVRNHWGKYYLEHGCANWPETCDFTQGSYCHGWGAWPASFLMSEILGVQPAAPGFAQTEIAPHPGDLVHVRGTVPTPLGDVSVAWRRDAPKGMTLEIASPSQRSYLVRLPSMGQPFGAVTLNGSAIWYDGAFVPGKNVEQVESESDDLCFRLKAITSCRIERT